jgi:uncharacterized protein YndB with AHSA1/START domain
MTEETTMKNKLVFLIFGLAMSSASGAADLAPIYAERCINADIEEVWRDWTTADGIRSFFAREGTVDARIDGEYSVLFYPDNPKGLRGAENMRIVAIEPNRRLVVTWNHPARFATIKEQRALVEYRLSPADCGTRVRIKHFGWGTSREWADAHAYFEGAWETILKRLEYRHANGPLDWDNLPDHLWYRGPTAAIVDD